MSSLADCIRGFRVANLKDYGSIDVEEIKKAHRMVGLSSTSAYFTSTSRCASTAAKATMLMMRRTEEIGVKM